MIRIGILKETKIPKDNRVPFTPKQCATLLKKYNDIEIVVQPSDIRCFTNEEYKNEGITLSDNLENCDIIFGVKEVKPSYLLHNKTYLFFSHTKKKQAYNQPLMHELIKQKIRMIDYECLVHDDGQRVVGFGFFAGIVGAHNGILTYGKKFKKFELKPVYQCHNLEELIHTYFGMRLPNFKIALTGSGRVASGLLEVMNLLDIKEVDKEDYCTKQYEYPVFVHLKGRDLYSRKIDGAYNRDEFHSNPERYNCNFLSYTHHTDILLNGIYWDNTIPRLFELEDLKDSNFKISVIADVTCDVNGSIPCNVEATTIENPVYGFDKETISRTEAFVDSNEIIDIMAVDNLPNELPRDASHYFGEFMEKYVLNDLIHHPNSEMLNRATICEAGKLTKNFEYLSDYAYLQ